MSDGKALTFIGHLDELRRRLLRSVIAIAVAVAISFIFREYILDILLDPVPVGVRNQMQAIGMTEMIGTYMKMSLVAGIVLVMPYLVYHLIMYVSPALTRKEKRYVYLILPWVALMFAGGIAFCYFILLTPLTNFLGTFGGNQVDIQLRIGDYVSVVTRFLLALGLVFEMPVIILFLARIGVVTSKWLASKRKFAIVGGFILAAIITPTFDPVNQTLVAAPLIVLYEMSIWLARLVQRKRSEFD